MVPGTGGAPQVLHGGGAQLDAYRDWVLWQPLTRTSISNTSPAPMVRNDMEVSPGKGRLFASAHSAGARDGNDGSSLAHHSNATNAGAVDLPGLVSTKSLAAAQSQPENADDSAVHSSLLRSLKD